MSALCKINGSIVDMTGDGVWPHMSKEIREQLIARFFDVDWKVHDIHCRRATKPMMEP